MFHSKAGKHLSLIFLCLIFSMQTGWGVQQSKFNTEGYPLISKSDLYCSFFIHDGPLPEIQITGAERGDEKILFGNGELVYLNKGRADGLEAGQLFTVLELEEKIGDFGLLVHRRARARITILDDHTATAQVEEGCGPVRIGQYLVPFEEKEGLLGRDLGYPDQMVPEEQKTGRFIYLQDHFVQIGSQNWAVIDLGEANGIKRGDQLIIFRKNSPQSPLHIFGNLVIIDVQKNTATVKILSCRDVINLNDCVHIRPVDTE